MKLTIREAEIEVPETEVVVQIKRGAYKEGYEQGYHDGIADNMEGYPVRRMRVVNSL